MFRKIALSLVCLSICSVAFADDAEALVAPRGSSMNILGFYSAPEYIGGEFRASSMPHFSLAAGAAVPIGWMKSNLSWAFMDVYFDPSNMREYIGIGVLSTWNDGLFDDGVVARVGYTAKLSRTMILDVSYWFNLHHALFEVPINYIEHTVGGVETLNYRGSISIALGLRL